MKFCVKERNFSNKRISRNAYRKNPFPLTNSPIELNFDFGTNFLNYFLGAGSGAAFRLWIRMREAKKKKKITRILGPIRNKDFLL
jgi:hypothetical protein